MSFVYTGYVSAKSKNGKAKIGETNRSTIRQRFYELRYRNKSFVIHKYIEIADDATGKLALDTETAMRHALKQAGYIPEARDYFPMTLEKGKKLDQYSEFCEYAISKAMEYLNSRGAFYRVIIPGPERKTTKRRGDGKK